MTKQYTADMVNHPSHYNSYSVEVIEVTRNLTFDIGNAVKYMLRHPLKGASRQDLEKALWYLSDHLLHWPNHNKLIISEAVRNKFRTLIDDYSRLDGSLPGVVRALNYIYADSPRDARLALHDALDDL